MPIKKSIVPKGSNILINSNPVFRLRGTVGSFNRMKSIAPASSGPGMMIEKHLDCVSTPNASVLLESGRCIPPPIEPVNQPPTQQRSRNTRNSNHHSSATLHSRHLFRWSQQRHDIQSTRINPRSTHPRQRSSKNEDIRTSAKGRDQNSSLKA